MSGLCDCARYDHYLGIVPFSSTKYGSCLPDSANLDSDFYLDAQNFGHQILWVFLSRTRDSSQVFIQPKAIVS